MINKIQNSIYLLLLFGVFTSCIAQKEIKDLYTRVVPDTHKIDLFYGKVNNVRIFNNFLCIKQLDEDLWKRKYKYAFGKIEGFYTTLNTYGKITDRYRLRDSINEQVIDTLKKNRGLNVYHIYKDADKKLKYKTIWKIPFHVYNPYCVILNEDSYSPYRYKVLKDSSHKKINFSYEYVLDKMDNTKILEEKSYQEYDMDMDGILEEKELVQHNFYEFDEKRRIISKTYTFPNYEKQKRLTGNTSCIDDCLHSIPTSRNSKKTFIYDDQGNLVSYTLYSGFIAYKEEYTYKDGVLIIKDRYWPRPFIDNIPFMKLHERFYYNKKSVIVSKEGINNDGSIDYKLNFTYEYDEKGNWIERKSYIEGDTIMGTDPFVITKRIIEYYNE